MQLKKFESENKKNHKVQFEYAAKMSESEIKK